MLIVALMIAGCVGDNSAGEGGATTTTTGAVTTEATNTTSGSSENAGDLLDQLQDQKVAPAASAPIRSAATGGQLEAVKQYLSRVVANADAMWASVFSATGLREQMFSYVVIMPGEQYTTKCGGDTLTSQTNNAYYCKLDNLNPGYTGAIWLPAETFLEMWSGDIFDSRSKSGGDFAAAIVAVHEVGHEIVQELADQESVPMPTGMYAELIADCFAGVWLAHVYRSEGLSLNHYNQAVDGLEAIGDYDYFAPGHHGTRAERRAAIEIGYFGVQGATGGGEPRSCIMSYWK